MEKVVVTGATSMIGSSLLRRLVKDKHISTIYAVVRPLSIGDIDKRNRIPKDNRIQIIECDMSNYATLSTLINDNCDVFFHLAWPRTATYSETIDDVLLKCDALKSVVEAINAAKMLGCRSFVGAGSQAEYGVPIDGKYVVGMECKPVRVDGIIHLAAYKLARTLSEQYGLNCIWMRIFSVYGVYDRNNSMISSTIYHLIKGEHCSFTKSEQMWDYINADDVADAFYLVGNKVYKHAEYNISSGVSKPLKRYIEIIRDIIDKDAVLGFGEKEYPTNPIMNMDVDISNLIEDTGWKPKISFEQGIINILNYIGQ